MLYHTIDTCGVINSRIFTHTHTASFFFKKHDFAKLTLFLDLKKIRLLGQKQSLF